MQEHKAQHHEMIGESKRLRSASCARNPSLGHTNCLFPSYVGLYPNVLHCLPRPGLQAKLLASHSPNNSSSSWPTQHCEKQITPTRYNITGVLTTLQLRMPLGVIAYPRHCMRFGVVVFQLHPFGVTPPVPAAELYGGLCFRHRPIWRYPTVFPK